MILKTKLEQNLIEIIRADFENDSLPQNVCYRANENEIPGYIYLIYADISNLIKIGQHVLT